MSRRMKKVTALLLAGVLSCGITAGAALEQPGRELVGVGLWSATQDKASMGNVATDNNTQALYDPEENTLQVATNPVNVSGYISAVTAAQYDSTGKGDFLNVEVCSTNTVETGTKYDGTNHIITYLSAFEIPLPSYLTKIGVEYIPFKMMVPYTPMDVVVGTGYLDARLRIDWDGAVDTPLLALVPNDEMSSGTVENVELSDPASGILLSADTTKVASDARLSVVVLTDGEAYELAQEALAGTVDGFDLYQVGLMVGESELSPNGAVELLFPYAGSLSMHRINDDGTKTVLKGTASDMGYRILTTKVGLFAVAGGTKLVIEPQPTPVPDNPFADIDGHWAQNEILTAVSAGLFQGTSATTFTPDKEMTGGMIISVIYRMAGTPEVAVPSSLPNVTPGSWYEKATAWGLEQGLVGGYTTFDPKENATREELATILYRYHSLSATPGAGASLSQFSDAASLSPWAEEAVAWANADGILNGTSATTLSPAESATRAQVAAMLCRYIA